MYGLAILEELDYLCNLNRLQVLPHANRGEKNTSQSLVKSVWKGQEREMVHCHHVQNHSEGCDCIWPVEGDAGP